MITAREASPADLLAMSHAAGGERRLRLPLTRSGYRVLSAQMAVSDAWALVAPGDAAPFAICGGAFLPAGGVEAWFVVRPGGLSGAALLAAVRLGRAKLDATGVRSICFVGLGNKNGERLAALLGFFPGEEIREGAREWRRFAHAGG